MKLACSTCGRLAAALWYYMTPNVYMAYCDPHDPKLDEQAQQRVKIFCVERIQS